MIEALQEANERAWKALEIALAGDSLWERCKAVTARSEDKAFGEQVRTFLDAMSLGELAEGKSFREQCLKELRAARKANLLTGGALDARELARQAADFARFSDPQGLLDAEWGVVGGMAEELRQAGYTSLAWLLTQREQQGVTVLVVGVRYFFRRAVEDDPKLFQGMAFACLERLQQRQERGFAAIHELMRAQGRRLDALLTEVHAVVVETHGVVLDVLEEQRRLESQNDEIYRGIIDVQRRLEMLLQCEVRPQSRANQADVLVDYAEYLRFHHLTGMTWPYLEQVVPYRMMSWQAAAEQGITEAYVLLGACSVHGVGMAKDFSHAMKWYRKAADAGNNHALYCIGCLYAWGYLGTRDYGEAMAWYLKAAELGSSAAMCDIGRLYVSGHGLVQDYAQAMAWFRKAANQGHTSSMSNIGWLYEKGFGVGQDYDQAMSWYRKAADLGNACGMCNLGICYERGWGVTQDLTKAITWYRKAADLGDVDAMYNLGSCYEKGEGLRQDYAKALDWFREAADLGGAAAMYKLGVFYQGGLGVARNLSEALDWYRKAADLGNVDAQYTLGEVYRDGTGVTKNLAEARRWFRLSAAQGDKEAKEALEGLDEEYVEK